MKLYLIPLVALAAFLWLAQESLHREPSIDQLVSAYDSSKTRPYVPRLNKDNYQLADLWNLTEEDIAKPVRIFGEEGEVK